MWGLPFWAVTAPFFSCAVPTLPAERRIAAYPVPLIATTSAKNATAIAGDGASLVRIHRFVVSGWLTQSSILSGVDYRHRHLTGRP